MEGNGQEILNELEPALRTTLQPLGEPSICSPDASAQVLDASAQEPGVSARLNCLLQELKGLVKTYSSTGLSASQRNFTTRPVKKQL